MVSQNMSIDIPILSLPKEIIEEEILPRLAVKPLLRFRCVSKSWALLIDSEGFIKSHHKNSIKNPCFPHQRAIIHCAMRPRQCAPQSLLNEPSTDLSTLDDPINIYWVWHHPVGCCNGLVCILEESINFYVWNPSTGIAKKLPEVPNRDHVMMPGFGWVESSGEYKVLGVFFDDEDPKDCGLARVYSSKTNSWKTLTEWDSPVCTSGEGICVDEKLHWDVDRDKFPDIFFFDLKSEVSGTMDLPFNKDCRPRPLLGEIGGCLCVLYEYRDGGVRVWVMKKYGVKESWESLAHVLDLIERPFSAPLIVGENGAIIVLFGVSFLVYYRRDNVFRFPNYFFKLGGRRGYLYVESLVKP